MKKKNASRKEKSLTPAQARSLALSAQGLDRTSPFGKGKTGVLETIRRLSYVQLDTLAVVARAHHHTLWTRNGTYREAWLNELMEEKSIFEYWSHAAAYLPMEDFRFSLVRKEEFRKGRSHWFQKDKKIMQYVLDRISAEGALQAKDFETDRKRGSWFDWKPAKIALEQLFHDGTLMVAKRNGFQKVYDLTERIVPAGTNTALPSQAEFAIHLIRNSICAHGIASFKDMTHLRRGMQTHVTKALKKMLADGEIEKVMVEGVAEDFFLFAGTEPVLSSKRKRPASVSFLSPFDNAIIRRDRLVKLFGYDYAIECYLPEPKRKFGYFCLPVLYNGNFVGRFDPKADRATGVFHVKKFYLENAPEDMDAFLAAFAEALKTFAAFNSCSEIVIEKTVPAKLKAALKILLK